MNRTNGPEGGAVSCENKLLTGARALRVAFRTVHILGFAVLFGGHWFGIPRETLLPCLYWTVLSGLALMILELRAGFGWFLQLAGLAVIVKLVLLALIPLFWNARLPLLVSAMVISSLASHMPGALRHFSILSPKRNF